VTVDDLIRAIEIALGHRCVDDCSAVDTNGDRRVTIDEIVRALTRARLGCD
jgi:hypothetical protein